MGFSFKVAPGVRIRASRRGIRAGIGPRALRLHAGGGRPGLSTGIGPFGAYGSLGGRRRGRRRSSRGTSQAAYRREVAAANRAQKAAEAEDLLAEFDAIMSVHREDFPTATQPDACRTVVPTEGQLYRQFEREALKRIGLLRRSLRREARERARTNSQVEHARLVAEADAQQQALQRELDAWWSKMLANDADTVLAALEEAFEDNEAPAAAVGLHGDELSLVVLAPTIDEIPERMPSVTAAGNLSLRKINKSARNGYYVALVIGQLLVTLREAFGVAPSVRSVRAAVLRFADPDAYGRPRVDCLAAARFTRDALEGVRWDIATAVTIFNDVSTDRVIKQTAAGELRPIDMRTEPELRALIEAVDLSELEDAEDAEDD